MQLSRLLSAAIVVAAATVLSRPGAAVTIHVPGDFSTIQAALTAAAPGDLILVAPNTYTGPQNSNLDFAGKAVTLRGTGGAAATVISCTGGRGFVFDSGETGAAVVDGFTIVNGNVPQNDRGGGVLCINGSSPTIQNCVITHCNASFGGGMHVDTSSPTLINCAFIENCNLLSATRGAGLDCVNSSSLVVTGCTFARNSGDTLGGAAVSCHLGATTVITGCVMFANFGSSIVHSSSADVTLRSSTLALSQSVFGNTGGDWVGCIAGQLGVNGNFTLDPRFCDLRTPDLHLDAASSCLPGNHPGGAPCDLIGALGAGCATAVEPATWGAIKARY